MAPSADPVITGDLGTTGVSITGFPPGTLTGTEHVGDSVALTASTDMSLAYAAAKGQASTADYSTMSDLTGMTLYPGVYSFATGASLNGQLFLSPLGSNATNDAGPPSWTFQTGSALDINLASQVILQGNASACHVFWQVGATAKLAVGVEFVGNILAYGDVNVLTGASVLGGLYAENESVTLQMNALTVPVFG